MLEQDFECVIENALGKFKFIYNKDYINNNEAEFKMFGTDHTTIRLWLESKGFGGLEDMLMMLVNSEHSVRADWTFSLDFLIRASEKLRGTKFENLMIH